MIIKNMENAELLENFDNNMGLMKARLDLLNDEDDDFVGNTLAFDDGELSDLVDTQFDLLTKIVFDSLGIEPDDEELNTVDFDYTLSEQRLTVRFNYDDCELVEIEDWLRIINGGLLADEARVVLGFLRWKSLFDAVDDYHFFNAINNFIKKLTVEV